MLASCVRTSGTRETPIFDWSALRISAVAAMAGEPPAAIVKSDVARTCRRLIGPCGFAGGVYAAAVATSRAIERQRSIDVRRPRASKVELRAG